MKISVTHSTKYRYEFPVCFEPHVFRLLPRMSGAQRLLSLEIQIAPTREGSTECLHQDGNLSLNAWFAAPSINLSVASRFTVDLLRVNPFDYVLTGESLSLTLEYRQPLSTALAPYRNDAQVAESVKHFAQPAPLGARGEGLRFLTALSWQTIRHVTHPDGSPWPSDRTLNSGEGSCRDLAVLFCDVCRATGIAGRFVSGYEHAAASSRELYIHASAEAYLPVIGWRGYHPSRGIAVADRHVMVASGFHYDLASPVAGLYSGGSASQMDTSICVQVDDAS
jgi:transglutaminase-like putative cysteine protease